MNFGDSIPPWREFYTDLPGVRRGARRNSGEKIANRGSQSMITNWQFCGFTKDETRQAAFKKYEEWRKANPITKD
jgi:hypothetical protein